MAINPNTYYGTDIACTLDADAFLSPVTGLDVVRQDALHRLLTDDVLGPNGTGWGLDCRRLLGMDPSQVAVMGPVLSEVLTRDDRIDTADVAIRVIPGQFGLDNVIISAVCYTATGPFDLTLDVADYSDATLQGQTA